MLVSQCRIRKLFIALNTCNVAGEPRGLVWRGAADDGGGRPGFVPVSYAPEFGPEVEKERVGPGADSDDPGVEELDEMMGQVEVDWSGEKDLSMVD